MNRQTRRAPLALLLLATLLACTKPRTQIILLVDTDMAQGPMGTLTHVRITVKSPTTGSVRQRLTYPLLQVVNGQSFELPGTLGIAAADNDPHSVEVNVDAVSDPGGDGTARAAMFTYYAIAPFESERTKLLSVFLADRCRVLARECLPDETCGLNGCMPRTVGTLPDVTPDFRFDGGVRDGSALDGDLDAPGDGAPDDLADASTTDASTDDAADDAADATSDAFETGACPIGQRACGGACVDTSSDARNCGACGLACSTANATPMCRASVCRLACAAGFGDCDGDAANGCEASIASIANCGACGTACALPGVATQACVGGSCTVGACAAGRNDCDRVALNGCETDTQNDGANCGACGRSCGTGFVCSAGACAMSCSTGRTACGAACIDLRTNASNCGACGSACPARANAAAVCSAGACGILCNAGFADCDGNPLNGCEASLSAAVTCGSCTHACTALNAVSTCAAGNCGFVCNAGYGDCDGLLANGCETDTRSSAGNCGACGANCARPHATGACSGSACVVGVCDAGYADCDGNPVNGCEVDTRSAAAHCGGCGRACSFANATATCVSGACALNACLGGYANCDGVASNGCETNLNTSGAHCGACSNQCATLTVCSAGACVSTCPAGTTVCSGACVNTASDVNNCGRCGGPCTSLTNSTRTCAGGVCGFSCVPGYADCNRVVSDGCEASLATLSNCGACGLPCALPNASSNCATGACQVARCNAGWGDCDRAPLNGCERAISEDPLNCGACGSVCPSGPNGAPRCAAGACTFDCAPGYVDCDRNPLNGCEARVGGACGDGCSPGTLSCLGTSVGCVTTALSCGARCSSGGVPGVCTLTGLCSPTPTMCTDGGSVTTDASADVPADLVISSDRGLGMDAI